MGEEDRDVLMSCANLPNIADPSTTADEGDGGIKIGMSKTVASRPIRATFFAWDPDFSVYARSKSRKPGELMEEGHTRHVDGVYLMSP